MGKGRRYKKKEKKVNNFFVFYLIIVLITFINYSFSRYTATSGATATIKTAKFNIVVNEKELGKEEKFNLLLSPTNNTYNDKIAPDSEGYFEISINPSETYVSLEYEILFDMTKINSEGRTITLVKYTLDKGNTYIEMPIDNKINGDILLNENGAGFTTEDTVILRVYWEWTQDIINPTFENTTIQVTAIIKQKVANGSESVNG